MFSSLNRLPNASLRILLIAIATVSCFTIAMSQAQSDAADLQGTVRDSSGAVVANATVTARNTGTNVTRNATTNDEGFYKMVNLKPGAYEITVEAANFKKAIVPDV